MNPVRRHGKFMKNRAEKAGGYVKRKEKNRGRNSCGVTLYDNRRVWIFFGQAGSQKSYHDGRHPDKYDRVCTKRKRRSEIS